MIDKFPSEGWSTFALFAQGEVVYGTHTDTTTHQPKRHRETELYTPYGFIVPIEQNHQMVHQLLKGVNTLDRWMHVYIPIITHTGDIYQLDASNERVDVRYIESAEWHPDDIATCRIYSLSPLYSQVIDTVYHLTHSIDAVLDHLERYHGLRRSMIARRPITDIAAECTRRGCTTPIGRLKDVTKPRRE